MLEREAVRSLLFTAVAWFELALLAYFVIVNSLYLWFSGIAYVALFRHRRRWTTRELGAVMRSAATPGVSIIVPAWNEEAGIVSAVRSLLCLNYPQFEVVVVSDGSTDATIPRLQEAFGLVAAPGSYDGVVPTKPVRGIYRSVTVREVVAIDKANGGKSDAINAGLNAARFPLVCVIDADSVVEEHALTRAVLPFIEDPSTVAVGGIVRIGNGCAVEAGRVTQVRAPSSWLATFQTVEYLRAFLAARVAHSAFNALLIVSGAFGIFRRDALREAGGFSPTTVGEDMEIVVRLHRVCRENGRRYRIVFQPDPVVWTEAPDTRRGLASQRNRWQRGTLEVLVRHARMFGNPRYGRIGLIALPYYAIFETLGPVLEVVGLFVTLGAWWLGIIDWQLAWLLFAAAVLYGAVISVAAVLLEELTYSRYERIGDLLRVLAAAALENFGYRQLTALWRLQGLVDFLRGSSTWGAIPRKGLGTA